MHTKGPWKVGDGTYPKSDRFVWGSDGYLIADCSDINNRTSDEERANARLISAAPDLLEALREAQAVLAGTELNDEEDQSPLDVVRSTVSAAIAKAEGK